ncbi:unnamed protein product [Phytophthora fragariaefolia]|uniref:Unnamed protein product n=1 Tax=Phytophthora fragariaefolia TaxID=1490495 RepID=A0A9W6Y6X8_9STRA|nr:unnamed protein product [Phytophthora fragariaefolia]
MSYYGVNTVHQKLLVVTPRAKLLEMFANFLSSFDILQSSQQPSSPQVFPRIHMNFMNFTNKDLCSLLFTQETPKKAKYTVCGKMYKQGNGYTNQMHHLLKKHPDYPQLAEAAFRRGNPLGLTMPDQRTNEIFRWIEWCVFDRRPVSFCERALVRKNATMVPIAANILQKHIDLLYGYTRDVIAAKLPEKFGLVLDGWSSGGRHFIAIMAVYHDPSVDNPGSRTPGYDESIQCVSGRFGLLAFCPPSDEEDLGAQSLFDLIADTLSTFNPSVTRNSALERPIFRRNLRRSFCVDLCIMMPCPCHCTHERGIYSRRFSDLSSYDLRLS